MDSNQASSTFFGFLAGGYAAITKGAEVASQGLDALTWGIFLYTAILAVIGGVFGWCASEFMKFLKPKVIKLFSKLKKRLI
jgi:hypothetical protein